MEEVELIGSVEEIAQLSRAEQAEVITYAFAATPLRLATLLERGDLKVIQGFKAWAVELAAQAFNRGLTETVVLDASEIARRSERALALAVFAEQKAGRIATGRHSTQVASPRSHFTTVREHIDSYEMAGVDDESFEEIIKVLRIEGRLSRSAVATAAREKSGRVVVPNGPRATVPVSRMDVIREMAGDGATSEQIAEQVGISSVHVRRLAKRADVVVRADKLVRGTKKIDPERVIREAVDALSGIEFSINLLASEDFAGFTQDQVSDWLDGLDGPARAVRKLIRELRKQ